MKKVQLPHFVSVMGSMVMGPAGHSASMALGDSRDKAVAWAGKAEEVDVAYGSTRKGVVEDKQHGHDRIASYP